jgi:hypothetical protein
LQNQLKGFAAFRSHTDHPTVPLCVVKGFLVNRLNDEFGNIRNDCPDQIIRNHRAHLLPASDGLQPSPDSSFKAVKNLRVKAERSGANAQRSEPKGSLEPSKFCLLLSEEAGDGFVDQRLA